MADDKDKDKAEKTRDDGVLPAESEESVNDLEQQHWYHGALSRDEANPMLLRSSTKIGGFLVRTSPLLHGGFRLLICVRVAKSGSADVDVYSTAINKQNEAYFLSSESKNDSEMPKFTSVPELVHYYKVHRLPCGIRMEHGVKRQKWLLRHIDVEYDDVKGKLGAGNFCTVFRGTLRRKYEEPREVAIKRSNLTESQNQGTELYETRKQLIAEAKLMNTYTNDYVIKFYGLACDRPPFMVVMEFCAGGSLDSHLRKNGKEMDDFEKHTYLIETARGMRYLHTQNCLHRDLASRNCLISSEGIVKIADFGLSRTLIQGKIFKEALKEAPLRWMAPECIKKESEFSFKSDVWAYGVLIFEIYTNGGKPFEKEEDDMRIVRAIKQAKMPALSEAPQKIRAVLKNIWALKPDDRPTFQEILEGLVECLSDCTMANVKRMLANRLPNVKRVRMPNCDVAPDKVAKVMDESTRASRRERRNTSSRRHKKKKAGRTHSKATCVPSENVDQNANFTCKTPSSDKFPTDRNTKESTKEGTKELVKEAAKEAAKEYPKENTAKEPAAKEKEKEVVKELKEAPTAKDEPKETNGKETTKEPPRGRQRGAKPSRFVETRTQKMSVVASTPKTESTFAAPSSMLSPAKKAKRRGFMTRLSAVLRRSEQVEQSRLAEEKERKAAVTTTTTTTSLPAKPSKPP